MTVPLSMGAELGETAVPEGAVDSCGEGCWDVLVDAADDEGVRPFLTPVF